VCNKWNAISDVGGSIGFVNPCALMDSKFALDGVCSFRDNGSMTDTGDMAAHKLQMLVLERREPSRNMARFYVLAIEPTLFGDAALVREWGRMGRLGRRRLDLHADMAAAAEALDVWLDRKTRRGYRVRSPRLLPWSAPIGKLLAR
jgi:predicted DNA-binding WGR domain protein